MKHPGNTSHVIDSGSHLGKKTMHKGGGNAGSTPKGKGAGVHESHIKAGGGNRGAEYRSGGKA